MARALTAGMVTQVTAGHLRPIAFVELEFDSGTLRFWTGYGDLAWNAQTWTGTGTLGTLSPAEETVDLKAVGAEFMITGIPSSIIAIALAEPYHLRPARSWLGALDASGAVVADPYKWFAGRMDVMEMLEGGETASIKLTAENHLIDLERPRERRYTPEDQALVDATDDGLDFVAGLQDAEITWGTS